MKKLYIILGIILVSISSILLFSSEETVKYIDYNGFKLAMSVDGKNVETLPNGKYFLKSYECRGDTKITWDYETSILTYDNLNVNDRCSLIFESSPKLYDLVNIGDYIEYFGDSGCTGQQCYGWNVGQTDTDFYENYGWRVLYKEDNSVYIVSAGVPENSSGTVYDPETTIADMNDIALKYCNSIYLSNGACNYNTAHPFNGDDFYKFTSQYYGSENARYLSNFNGGHAYGEPNCYNTASTYCGYNNDLIALRNTYRFGSKGDDTQTLLWQAFKVNMFPGPISYGVRPVLKLDASITTTGGAGTMTNPYGISQRVSN